MRPPPREPPPRISHGRPEPEPPGQCQKDRPGCRACQQHAQIKTWKPRMIFHGRQAAFEIVSPKKSFQELPFRFDADPRVPGQGDGRETPEHVTPATIP